MALPLISAIGQCVRSPPATPYQCGEVPMKVPLPIRPMTRTPPQPPLPRGGPGPLAPGGFRIEGLGFRLKGLGLPFRSEIHEHPCRGGSGAAVDFDAPSSNMAPASCGGKMIAYFLNLCPCSALHSQANLVEAATSRELSPKKS